MTDSWMPPEAPDHPELANEGLANLFFVTGCESMADLIQTWEMEGQFDDG